MIIGAGMDSFCLRRPPFAAGLKIIELDHPNTQKAKCRRIRTFQGLLPRDFEFVAADLSQKTVSSALSASFFQKEERAFLSWLGVTPYIPREAIYDTFKDLKVFAASGSEIVFDNLTPWYQTGDAAALLHHIMIRIYTALQGERMQSFFDPVALGRKLEELGYRILENLSPAQQNDRYMKSRRDKIIAANSSYFFHIAVA